MGSKLKRFLYLTFHPFLMIFLISGHFAEMLLFLFLSVPAFLLSLLALLGVSACALGPSGVMFPTFRKFLVFEGSLPSHFYMVEVIFSMFFWGFPCCFYVLCGLSAASAVLFFSDQFRPALTLDQWQTKLIRKKKQASLNFMWA